MSCWPRACCAAVSWSPRASARPSPTGGSSAAPDCAPSSSPTTSGPNSRCWSGVRPGGERAAYDADHPLNILWDALAGENARWRSVMGPAAVPPPAPGAGG
ncbi:hypothetical protein NKH77_12045 [Streptomyces sp. M19]